MFSALHIQFRTQTSTFCITKKKSRKRRRGLADWKSMPLRTVELPKPGQKLSYTQMMWVLRGVPLDDVLKGQDKDVASVALQGLQGDQAGSLQSMCASNAMGSLE